MKGFIIGILMGISLAVAFLHREEAAALVVPAKSNDWETHAAMERSLARIEGLLAAMQAELPPPGMGTRQLGASEPNPAREPAAARALVDDGAVDAARALAQRPSQEWEQAIHEGMREHPDLLGHLAAMANRGEIDGAAFHRAILHRPE